MRDGLIYECADVSAGVVGHLSEYGHHCPDNGAGDGPDAEAVGTASGALAMAPARRPPDPRTLPCVSQQAEVLAITASRPAL